MKVLWIANNPLPEFVPQIKGKPVPGGSWIPPLAYALRREGVDLAIVTNVEGGERQKLVIDGITQYTIPIQKRGWYTVNDLYPELIKSYQEIEAEFAPDVIHIHGTERYFGLLTGRKLLKTPAIISIQGIITSYMPFCYGGLTESEIRASRSVKNILGRGGLNNQLKVYQKYVPIEKEIFASNQNYFCRTTWDRSHVISMSPGARIFHGEELLREAFYNTRWNLNKIQRHSIFISSGTIPIKGLHVMLEALSILRRYYPDVTLHVPLDDKKFYRMSKITSNDYELYLNRIIDKFDLRKNLVLTGRLNAEEMAQKFATSHVFVLPSYAENSPNSLGEAMMVGTPSVVAPVGGVPDMVSHNESALYAPCGDAPLWFANIKRVFEDDDLASMLSVNARKIAERRHDLTTALDQYMKAYEKLGAKTVTSKVK